MDIALTLRRKVDTEVLRSVLAAVREERSLDLHYQSMNRDRPDPAWRRITPHAFGFDGFPIVAKQVIVEGIAFSCFDKNKIHLLFCYLVPIYVFLVMRYVNAPNGIFVGP